jgi:signal transduction histidine kinase
MIQSQKLAALGVMAGGIAHEIRNPLAVCSSAAEFLLEENCTPEFRQECAGKIYRGVQRASAIIENLLRYSRPTVEARTGSVDLVTVIRETLALVAHHAELQRIETKVSLAVDHAMVRGAPVLLQQLLMNLFLNAMTAMPTGGILEVGLRLVAGSIKVRVADTGCGIAERDIERIFDPFYTTSTTGSGTGLGLSICYSIAKQHGGSIEVASVEGRGSTFTIKLPVCDE